MPPCPHLQNGESNIPCFVGLLGGFWACLCSAVAAPTPAHCWVYYHSLLSTGQGPLRHVMQSPPLGLKSTVLCSELLVPCWSLPLTPCLPLSSLASVFSFPSLSFFLFLFRAAPTAHGRSQARGRTGVAAARLHHSHSHAKSELHLQPTPQLSAMPDP